MLLGRKHFLWSLHLQDTEILLPREVTRASSLPHTCCLPSTFTSGIITRETHYVSPGLFHLFFMPQPATSRLTLYSAIRKTHLGPLLLRILPAPQCLQPRVQSPLRGPLRTSQPTSICHPHVPSFSPLCPYTNVHPDLLGLSGLHAFCSDCLSATKSLFQFDSW